MKKILVLSAFVFAAMVSQASYLYWQVEQDNRDWIYTPTGEKMTANVAVLHAVKDGTDIVVPGEWTRAPLFEGSGPYAMPQYAANLDGLTSSNTYSYYIELAAWDTAQKSFEDRISLAVSEWQSYSQLAANGYIQTSLTVVPQAWTGGTYAAPEPTSGMMILLGLAALALKRR